MNNETGTCLAITEKKAHPRPGGCVGIFFQLFDWNRRFAKKKLFSRKLLPPARTKRVSKKFGGDEKMPKTKLHLITDENSGGFPNVKKNANVNRCNGDIVEQKPEMRAPGLVARLMGLESMPAAKHKKASTSVACDAREERFGSSHCESDGENVSLEKGSIRTESRPQKLQKTSQFDRRVVTRFGAEALQIKSVLSRSRKHHHHQSKLTSPVKSPRLSTSRSGSRASRLIDAATRILEPGLQATNRAKCSLTYPSSIDYASKDDVLAEEIVIMSPNLREQEFNASYDADVGKSLMGQTSCKNCGNLLDLVDSRPTMEDQPFACTSSASNVVSNSSSASVRNKPRPLIFSSRQERDVAYQRNGHELSDANGEQDNSQGHCETMADRKQASHESQGQLHLRSQHCRLQKDDPSAFAFRQRSQRHNVQSVSRERIPSRSKLSNMQSKRGSGENGISGPKDFVAMNRNLSGGTRPRLSSKSESSTIDTERRLCSRQDDSSPHSQIPVRKRRTVSSNESSGLVNSISTKQRNANSDAASGKVMGLNGQSVDRASVKNKASSPGPGNASIGNKDNNVVSFTFNSPLRQKNCISTGLNEKTDQIDNNTPHPRKLALNENDGKALLQQRLPSMGDAFGVLLEQKIKELTSQEEEESTLGGMPPKRSTAMILQELIAALIAEQPISPDSHTFNPDTPVQNEKMRGSSVRFLHDSDHLSPGSVLEAPFSNDSCFSLSLDESSGRRQVPDSVDYCYDQPQPMETDADLLDSATSLNESQTASKMMTDLLNHISWMFKSFSLAGGGLTGAKLKNAKEIVLNAELLFGYSSLCNSDKAKSFLVGPFLLNELETLASAMRTNLTCLLCFEESKAGEQLKRFLFDCMIEFLDSKYGRYYNTGFKAWRRVPERMNSQILIQDVGEELRRWTSLAGKIPDEIVEWEMSHGLGKWTDFEVESYETGTEIDSDILQVLVEETVMDLCSC